MAVTLQVSVGTTVGMAELGFYYGCIGVRYFQKTLISQAVAAADGCLTASFVTVSGRRNGSTCSCFTFWPGGKSPECCLAAEGSRRASLRAHVRDMRLLIYFKVADWLVIVMLTVWTRWKFIQKIIIFFPPKKWPKMDFCGPFKVRKPPGVNYYAPRQFLRHWVL